MSNVVSRSNTNIPAEFQELFGPPPLYHPEDEKIYDTILCGIATDFGPLDTIGRIFLRDLADYAYEIQWLRRLPNKLMREVHKQRLARSAEKHVAEAKNRVAFVDVEKSVIAKDPKLSEAEKAAGLAGAESKIKQIRTETRQKLEELMRAEDGDIDEAALFRDWIPFYDAIQTQLTMVERKFRSTVQLLDEHQQGLGQRLRKVLEKIIDVKPENSSSAG